MIQLFRIRRISDIDNTSEHFPLFVWETRKKRSQQQNWNLDQYFFSAYTRADQKVHCDIGGLNNFVQKKNPNEMQHRRNALQGHKAFRQKKLLSRTICLFRQKPISAHCLALAPRKVWLREESFKVAKCHRCRGRLQVFACGTVIDSNRT